MIVLKCQLSDRKIKGQFRKLIFAKRIFCPRCGYTKIRVSENRYRCPKCRKPFSLISGTWLKDMKISWSKLYLILDCWLKGIDLKNVCYLVKVSYPTAFLWYRKFRLNVPKEAFKLSKNGYYLVDESYFGWKRKGNRGRGCQGRKPVFGIYDPLTGFALSETVLDVSEETLISIIQKSVPLNSTVVSDGWRSYWGLSEKGYQHIIIDHEKNFKGTNCIESCWSHQKRNLRKMYHHCWLENLPEYVRELTYRFCARKNPDSPLSYLQKSISLVPNPLH